jgi:hypothetical protein
LDEIAQLFGVNDEGVADVSPIHPIRKERRTGSAT